MAGDEEAEGSIVIVQEVATVTREATVTHLIIVN